MDRHCQKDMPALESQSGRSAASNQRMGLDQERDLPLQFALTMRELLRPDNYYSSYTCRNIARNPTYWKQSPLPKSHGNFQDFTRQN
jgi:hypothetical protein